MRRTSLSTATATSKSRRWNRKDEANDDTASLGPQSVSSSKWRLKDDAASLTSKSSSGHSYEGSTLNDSNGSWTTTIDSHQTSGTSAQAGDLFHVSLNPLAPVSVVFLHILFSSHLDWAHIWPKLSEYHLLIPDLPQHSRSRHVKPFSFALAADLVAEMIRTHAHDGKAHIVGMSTGGFIAMELIRRHPDVVDSTLISGAASISDFVSRATADAEEANANLESLKWQSVSSHPKLVYLGLSALLQAPSNFMLKASGWSPELQNDELLKEIRANTTSSLANKGVGDTRKWKDADTVEVARRDKRICMIAAGKQDHVEGIRDMARILRKEGQGQGLESRMFVVRHAIHAWNLQDPELFARTVRAWIEKRYMPVELEQLD